MAGRLEKGRLGDAPAFLQNTAVKGRVKGHFFIAEPGALVVEGETQMCAHCQKHWRIRPGSGISRGYCTNCDGPTCGKLECETRCVPFEKAIEIMEGRDPTKIQF